MQKFTKVPSDTKCPRLLAYDRAGGKSVEGIKADNSIIGAVFNSPGEIGLFARFAVAVSNVTFKKFSRERHEKTRKRSSILLPSTAKIPKFEEL
jgi:hypothetical protein